MSLMTLIGPLFLSLVAFVVPFYDALQLPLNDKQVLIRADLSKPYNLNAPKGTSIYGGWSQGSQDRIVHDSLRQMKDGYFIEAGAYDCEEYSNTLYLEKLHNWKGLLIEASPNFIPNCQNINRHKSSIAWAALDMGTGKKTLQFRSAGPVGGLVDNLKNNNDLNERIEEMIHKKHKVGTVLYLLCTVARFACLFYKITYS